MAKPKQNTAYYLTFAMIDETSTSDFLSSASVTATGYYKDGASAWASLTISNSVAEIGSTGIYGLTLTSSEMNHDAILIKLAATGAQSTYVRLDLDENGLDDVSTNVDAILADTGTDGVELSTTMLTKIADYVLKRRFSSARASSDGDGGTSPYFQSLMGSGARLVNKTSISGATMTTYEEDGTTAFGTQSVTTSAAADNITALGTGTDA